MVRRSSGQGYETTDSLLRDFDDSFIVAEEESYIIDDQKYTLHNALHIVKDGNEYVFINRKPFRINNVLVSPPVETTSPIFAFFSAMAIVLIICAFGFFVLGPLLAGFISDNQPAEHAITTIPTAKTNSVEEMRANQITTAMDYTNPTTRDFAVSIIPNSHEGNYNIAQICDLWDAVYNKWTYVNDPGGSDYFSPASRTIQLGLKGDCDDFAITVGSAVQSIGGSSRIITAYNDEGGHAYPEVLVCNSSDACIKNINSYIQKRYKTNRGIAYHTRTKDGVTQYWLNLDWQSRYPGGKFFHDSGELTIYYPNGYWYKSG
jgi:hypothetical protein